jgi:hypothetical protein
MRCSAVLLVGIRTDEFFPAALMLARERDMACFASVILQRIVALGHKRALIAFASICMRQLHVIFRGFIRSEKIFARVYCTSYGSVLLQPRMCRQLDRGGLLVILKVASIVWSKYHKSGAGTHVPKRVLSVSSRGSETLGTETSLAANMYPLLYVDCIHGYGSLQPV